MSNSNSDANISATMIDGFKMITRRFFIVTALKKYISWVYHNVPNHGDMDIVMHASFYYHFVLMF